VETFRDRRAPLLLALLATAPDQARSRDSLADLLWPEIDRKTQRARLRWLLHVVRAALSEDVVVNEGNALVRLNPHTTSDLQELDRTVRRLRAGSLPEHEHRAVTVRLSELKNQILLPADDHEPLVLALRSDRLEEIQTALESLYRALAPLPAAEVPPDFVGRLAELREIQQWLSGAGRLLTLIGLGGIGKTRLAQEALVSVPHTAVALANTSGATGFWEALREALRLPKQGEGATRYRVLTHLSAQPHRLLLALDNLEQFGSEITPLLEALLGASPQVRLLATSRRATQVGAEQLLRVPPLPHESSVQLFLLRARAVKPSLALTAHSGVVRELCEQLQGLALSIELAAARVSLLSVSEILRQLNDQLAFLRTTRPQWSERHRSQQAALQWSYNLLPPSAQEALRSLALFRGAFTLEMAQWLFPSSALIDALEQLQLNSLLLVEDADGESQFRFLVVVREFGLACLATSEEERHHVERRHTDYVLHQIEGLQSARPYQNWDEAVAVVQRERENLSEVIQRAAQGQDADTLLSLVNQIAYLYSELGLWRDLAPLLTAVHALPAPQVAPQTRTYLLGLQAALARRVGEGETAWRCWQEKLALHEQRTEATQVTRTLMEILCQAVDEDRWDAIPPLRHALDERLSGLPHEAPDRVLFEIHQIRSLEKTGASEEALRRSQQLLTWLPIRDGQYYAPVYYLTPVVRRLGDTEATEALVRAGLQQSIEKRFVFGAGVLTLELAYLRQAQNRLEDAGQAYLIARELNRRLESRLEADSQQALQQFLEMPALPQPLRESFLKQEQVLSGQTSDTLIQTLLIGVNKSAHP